MPDPSWWIRETDAKHTGPIARLRQLQPTANIYGQRERAYAKSRQRLLDMVCEETPVRSGESQVDLNNGTMQKFPENVPSLARKNYTAMRAFLRAGLRNEVEAFLQVVNDLTLT